MILFLFHHLLSFEGAKYTSPEVPEFKVRVSYLSVNVETIPNLDHSDQSREKLLVLPRSWRLSLSSNFTHLSVQTPLKLLLRERHEITQ